MSKSSKRTPLPIPDIRDCPVGCLEWKEMDTDGEIIVGDPERPQEYCSTLLGYGLGDDGGFSIADIRTGEGRNVDNQVAEFFVAAVNAFIEIRK